MEGQGTLVLVVRGLDEVPALFKNLLHRLVAVGSFGEGHAAGDVEARDGILLREVDDTHAAAVGLVGIGRPLEDGLHEGPRVDADLSRPRDDALGCPFEMEAVVGWPVLRRGRVAGAVGALVEGDASVIVIYLDGPRGDGDLDLLPGVGEGHRVGMPVFADLDVVVEADGRGPEARVLVADGGKALQGGPVDGLEELLARVRKPLEALRVVDSEELSDGEVELVEGIELAVAQGREDARVHDVDRTFHEGLVAGRVRTGREDDRPVVAGVVGVVGVDLALVAIGLRHAALEAVGHDGGRYPAEEQQGVSVSHDEVLLLLRAEGFHVGVLARAKDGHEEFRFALHAVLPIPPLRPSEVDIHPVPGLVLHREGYFGL